MENYEADELGRYTSLSSLAVCACLLGLASPLALLAPLLIVIPIVGIIVALVALARIGASEGGLSGRKLAHAALVLSIVCVVAAPLRVEVRNRLYKSQADEAARVWLTWVSQNKSQEAFGKLSGNAMQGLAGPPPAEGPPPPLDEQTIARNLGSNPLVSALREKAKQGELEFTTQAMTCDTSAAFPRAVIHYQTVKPDNSLTMQFVLVRSSRPEKAWLIDSWKLEGETSHNHNH